MPPINMYSFSESCDKYLVDIRSDDVVVSSVPSSSDAFMSLKGSVTPFRVNPQDNGEVVLTYVIKSAIEVAVSSITLTTQKASSVIVEQFIDSSLAPFFSEVRHFHNVIYRNFSVKTSLIISFLAVKGLCHFWYCDHTFIYFFAFGHMIFLIYN